MTGFFVDTSVFVLAAGDPHRERDASRAFLASASAAGVDLHVCVEAVQEFVFHRLRRGSREAAVALAREMSEACVVHPFDADVLSEALRLVEETALRGRDAVHAAAALVGGFDTIVSLDADFDGMSGLSRLHPAEALG